MKTRYIIPNTCVIEAQTMATLMSSGSRGFHIPGVGIDFDNRGDTLNDGV